MMPTITEPIVTPVMPVRVEPEADPWSKRFTDPIHICPQQKREFTSPDVMP